VICDILGRLQAGEELHEYPARLRCKDGSIKDVLIDSSVMFRDGGFVHTRCFTRDVTDRKRAEERVRFQARMLDTVGQAAVVTDPDGTIIYWNRFAERSTDGPAAKPWAATSLMSWWPPKRRRTPRRSWAGCERARTGPASSRFGGGTRRPSPPS